MYSPRYLGYEEIGDKSSQVLHSDGQNEILTTIYGYKHDKFSYYVYHTVSLLLLGIPYAVYSWFPAYKAFKYKRSDLRHADLVLVSNTHGSNVFLPIESMCVRLVGLPHINVIRYFYYQHVKYVFSHINEEGFIPLDQFVRFPSIGELIDFSSGVMKHEQSSLIALHGPNIISVEVKSYWELFVTEVFNPYNVFQLFSIILWSLDHYLIYASCIFVLTMFSILTTLRSIRKQSLQIRDIIESSNSESAQVLRPNIICDHTIYDVKSSELVPGDLLLLPPTGCLIPCDALLLTGSCIVNESMLTGESVPVTKSPPVSCDEIYDPAFHKRHTLYAGTSLLQTRKQGHRYVLARVVRTGFDTTKGSLIKSILYPKPVNLKFHKDSIKFIFFLLITALFGMTYSVYLYVRRSADFESITLHVLDIVTIAVPPALPAAMNIGIGYSQERLKKLKLFCVSPNRINLAGMIKLACFDKTGTLTEDSLELNSVLPCDENKHYFSMCYTDVSLLNPRSYFLKGMAVCHSLTRIHDQLIGDPLDINLFENTGWQLEDPNEETGQVHTIVKSGVSHSELHILRTFVFSSNRQCMSVICKEVSSYSSLINSLFLYSKGAPEKIRILCREETIPFDFQERLTELTANGFRVIALAYKPLFDKSNFSPEAIEKIKRDDIEQDLIFLGLISMQNPIKPETTSVIGTIKAANVRPIMITGDNIRTAISVAHECGMIPAFSHVVLVTCMFENSTDAVPTIVYSKVDLNEEKHDEEAISLDYSNLHFALDGKTWTNLRIYYSDLIPKLLVKGTVFARFQPDQKTQLVEQFQSLDYVVSMVGDGANDCGALKAAHVGISLSQAVAGVAAPFTYMEPNISCILHLILEGRCALTTSFAVFKYMAMYSLIQFISVILLYRDFSNLGDIQFLFIDMIITTSLAISIARQGPSEKLTSRPPLSSLISLRNVIPLLLQVFLCGAFQALALYYLSQQIWFTPTEVSLKAVYLCWENTVIFSVSTFQYLILAIIYCPGRPYRESRLKNYWFIFICVQHVWLLTWMLVSPPPFLANFFGILPSTSPLHTYFRYNLILFPVTHAVSAIFIEYFVSERVWLKQLIHLLTWKTTPKNKYNKILKETNYYNLTISL